MQSYNLCFDAQVLRRFVREIVNKHASQFRRRACLILQKLRLSISKRFSISKRRRLRCMLAMISRILPLCGHMCTRVVSSSPIMRQMSASSRLCTVSNLTSDIMMSMKNEKYRSDGGRILRKESMEQFITLYNCSNIDEKRVILLHLSHEYGCHKSLILKQCENLVNLHDKERENSTILQAELKLKQLLKPSYHMFFSQLGSMNNGIKFLIDMRYDALREARNSFIAKEEADVLTHLSEDIKEILSMWFSVGLLQLHQITWKTPANVLEKLAKYEAVHAVKNWMDMKHRLGKNRRCYAFFHGNMPDEPVIVLHVALTGQISSDISTILDYRDDNSNDSDAATTPECAIFYSITSTQKGLQGIELGAYLIQLVVEKLKNELPQLKKFSSLSPIPGFRKWMVEGLNEGSILQYLGKADKSQLEIARQTYDASMDMYNFMKSLAKNLDKLRDEELASIVKEPLMNLCAIYICNIKRRSYALDSVANFHLKNGAVVWRINWMADTSAAGMKQSYGLMVNYRYYLDDMAENSNRYITKQEIHTSDPVKLLLQRSNLQSNL